jgi:murein DD-endopeptidase MepM/ murein hydrolase activator NlpD
MNMTNFVDFSDDAAINFENNTLSVLSKNSPESSANNFKQLFAAMLSTSTSLSVVDTSSKSTDMMGAYLLLFFSQIFSSNLYLKDQKTESNAPSGIPLHGAITQGCSNSHTAIDFGVPTGTAVHTTMSGKVVYAGWNNEGYGNLVIVESGNYRTFYAHLSEITKKSGDIVKTGNEIGLSGNTGNSTGPHLHYEVRKNGIAIDPATTMTD